ncbi:MAG TPA: hypothetical protein VJA85_00595 [Candidatus Limnocylindria bacterium]|nr:hypothetical protein [Candidatus Limnocylindria bacterium]
MDRLRTTRTLTSTAVSALGALLMVGAITFGATAIRPWSANLGSDGNAASQDATASDGGSASQDGNDADGSIADLPPDEATDEATDEVTDATGADAADNPNSDSEATPKPEATEQPTDKPDQPEATPKPQPEPTDKPPAEPMQLEAFFNFDLGKIVVKWYPYTGDFEVYKLVRSIDDNPSWPLSGEDVLVAVIGLDGQTKFIDADAPCGVELHYRAFAVVHGEDGYIVKAASNVDGVFHECSDATPTPAPEPYALGFEAFQGEAGIVLHWEACTSESFAVYKVVRSATDPEPMYPLHDGDELLAAIGDKGVTAFTDTQVEAGQTWTYRVLALGEGPDGWVVLGLSAPISITVQ